MRPHSVCFPYSSERQLAKRRFVHVQSNGSSLELWVGVSLRRAVRIVVRFVTAYLVSLKLDPSVGTFEL